jgi:hypothetical protein
MCAPREIKEQTCIHRSVAATENGDGFAMATVHQLRDVANAKSYVQSLKRTNTEQNT